jgi:hypothetical protein
MLFNDAETYFMLQHYFFKNTNIEKKLKLILKNTIADKTLTYTSETSTMTNRDRKRLNIFERKVYGRILGPVYDSETENRRILTNNDIYVTVKKPTKTETIRLHRLCWFGDVQIMEGNRTVLVWECTDNGRKQNCVGLGMYREWKKIELCWFGDVQRMEENRIVLVWGCTENGRK